MEISKHPVSEPFHRHPVFERQIIEEAVEIVV